MSKGLRWTEEDLRAKGFGRYLQSRDTEMPVADAPPRTAKYGNRKTIVGSSVFRSKREAEAFTLLQAREHIGEIQQLRREVEYNLVVNGIHVCDYRADFTYLENGRLVVADAKGHKTKDYILKRKLMHAVHGVQILEM